MIQISAPLIHSVMSCLRFMPLPIKRERSVCAYPADRPHTSLEIIWQHRWSQQYMRTAVSSTHMTSISLHTCWGKGRGYYPAPSSLFLFLASQGTDCLTSPYSLVQDCSGGISRAQDLESLLVKTTLHQSWQTYLLASLSVISGSDQMSELVPNPGSTKLYAVPQNLVRSCWAYWDAPPS